MNRYLKLILFCFTLATLSVAAQPLYVGSYNIRYQNNDDTKSGNGWTTRCAVVCSQLNFEHPDIFGTQEVLDSQLHDMLQQFDGYLRLAWMFENCLCASFRGERQPDPCPHPKQHY